MDQNWFKKAKCKDHDASFFFPETGETVAAKKALAVCKTCPVRAECLTEAVNNAEQFGVWGGFTQRGRRKIANKYGKPFTVEKAREIIGN